MAVETIVMVDAFNEQKVVNWIMSVTATVVVAALGAALYLKVYSPPSVPPCKPISMSESRDYNGKNVILEGLPIPYSIRDDGFVIKNGTNMIYVTRANNPGSIRNYGLAREALEKEAMDSDNQNVKVCGTLNGDTIDGRVLDIEGNWYLIR